MAPWLSNCCFHQLSDEAFEAEDAEAEAAEATALRLQLLTVAIILAARVECLLDFLF